MHAELLLSQIWIYPVKSLGGITLQKAAVEERGLQYDRRWLVIDANNRFVSQRECPQMALVGVALQNDGLFLTHREAPPCFVPFLPQTTETLTVTVWDDEIQAVVVNEECSAWLSQVLGGAFRLVFMPDTSTRPADPTYAHFNANVSFADGFPYLLIGQASLDDLNTRLHSPVTMQRFRPNLVVEGSLAYDEDQWFEFLIGTHTFFGIKPCARCIMTTIDPQLGQRTSSEPVKTLSNYRKVNNKIYFGQNVITRSTGLLSVGDSVRVMSRKTRKTSDAGQTSNP